ncbi:hypothetical protein [Edwardsiella tarda]|uniref:hypothetical protein n=1 Tax=Edwardsiella tarda TaxID=636 RepID=UPI00351D8BB4
MAELAEEDKDRVKRQILARLQRDYALEEADLLRAELALVPAGRAAMSAWMVRCSAATVKMIGCASIRRCRPCWRASNRSRP